jgi:hypothetical protein
MNEPRPLIDYSASELRISVFLLADRDSKSGAGVNMNVLAIDTDTAKHQTSTRN